MTSQDVTPEQTPRAFTIASMSWLIVREALESMPTLFVTGFVVYALVNAAAWECRPAIDRLATSAVNPSVVAVFFILVQLPEYFLRSVVLAAIAIPIHRLVLRDETAQGPVKLFATQTLVFAGWLVLFQFAPSVLFLPVTFIATVPHATALAMIVAFAGFIGLFVVGTRLSLLFPDVALGLPSNGFGDRLARAWNLSRGRFWRIFGSTFLAGLPLGVVFWILGLIVLAVLPSSRPGDEIANLSAWQAVLDWLIGPIGAALGAAVLSWNYRFAEVERAAQSRG